MGKITGLVKRGGVYRYRTRIPEDIRSAFLNKNGKPRVEVSESLHTSDYTKAASLAKIAAGKWASAFEEKSREARSLNSPTPTASATQELCGRLFSHDDAQRLALRYWERKRDELDATSPPLEELTHDDIEFFEQELDADEIMLENGDNPETLLRTGNVADELMNEHKLVIPDDTQGYQLFRDFLRRALLDITRLKRARLGNDFSAETYDDLFFRADQDRDRVTIQEARKQFWNDKITAAELTKKTENKRTAALDMLVEHFGSTTFAHEVTRTQCRAFRDLIERLPPRFSQHYKGRSLNEIAEIAERENLPRMAYNTRAGYIRMMGRLFDWLRQEQYIHTNPSEGLDAQGAKGANEEARDPFSFDQLKAIFNAPLYTGCVDDERGFSKVGDKKPKRGRFWLPLISLYSGLRMGEILQLSLSDIGTSVKGTPFFHIHKDMTLKNPNAVREVPIHTDLVRMGLLRFVEDNNTDNDIRLFDEIPIGSDGYISSTFSKRFNTFLNSADAKTNTTAFHSFRHNFRDALREAGVTEEHAEALGGWSRGGKASRSYGKGHSADALYADVSKVRYEGIDLGHLYVEVSNS